MLGTTPISAKPSKRPARSRSSSPVSLPTSVYSLPSRDASHILQVCTLFLALSLREAGYTVFANADASGTFDVGTSRDANDRMRDAGVIVISQFAILADLMRDWRNTPGTEEVLPFVHEYVQAFLFNPRNLIALQIPSCLCVCGQSSRRSCPPRKHHPW
jgi:hypothetical protein